MEWISIKEKLPNEYVPILCLAYSFDRRFKFVYEAIYLSPREMNLITTEKSNYSSQKIKAYSPFAPKIFDDLNTYFIHLEGRIVNPIDRSSILFEGEVTHWLNLPSQYPAKECYREIER